MYYLKKTFEVAGAHKLRLPYDSKCKQLHGHNWKITVYLKGAQLNQDGMLVDFAYIKETIGEEFDHKCLNDLPHFKDLGLNPTAENIARHIAETLTSSFVTCYKVEVQESEGNVAIWEA